MTTTWNSNTVLAGKWLAVTIGALVLFFSTSILGVFELPLTIVLGFVTTYYGVAAMRCKLATRKDYWAGFVIVIIGGAIMLVSTGVLWNELQNRLY